MTPRRGHITQRTTVSIIHGNPAINFQPDEDEPIHSNLLFTVIPYRSAWVAVERRGNAIIMADTNSHVIRKITPAQNHHAVSTLAGTGVRGIGDGEGTVAMFNKPKGVAVDEDGNVIVADTDNHLIRKITTQGQVSTLAGTGEKGFRDGVGTVAQFDSPSGVAVDGDVNVVVTDTDNNRIRKITPDGQVSTLAGSGYGPTAVGHQDGEGTAALFNYPFGVAVDEGGNIIVADKGNHCIRLITPQGHVSTLAGTGEEGCQNGEGTVAQFYFPTGVAVDGGGNIIVADEGNDCIRLITSQGQVSTLAGTCQGDHEDEDATSDILFRQPSGVAVDGDGNVIVVDACNGCIRCVASAHIVIPWHVEFLNHAALPALLQSSFASDQQHHDLFDLGSFHDVCFVVEQERVHAHKGILSAWCEYFSSMFGAGFKEGNSAEMSIKGTASTAFKALLKYLYTDNMEQECVHAHRGLLSARCEYFRSMFGAGFKEGDSSADIPIKGTSSAAFKALLKYLYTDNMEVDDAVLFDLASLCDQYRVERLFNYCLHQLFKGITIQNAVMQLVQVHTASGEGNAMWGKLKSATMEYVTRNFKEIWYNARATLELLDREHHELYVQILIAKCGVIE
jgi:sugar lactone lactonase YvrE